MEKKGRIYEKSKEKSFEDDLDDFDDNTVLDKELDVDKPDEVSLKVKKTRRPQTEKQKAAFARCREIRAEKVSQRKELQKSLKEQPPRKCKKPSIAPKKVAFEEESSDEEIIYKKPKPKKKPRVVYQEPSSEDSSDEEVVAIVKRRKKPKQKPKKPKPKPKVIYQDELESTEEDESPRHEIDLPYQPQLYIV